MQQPNCAGTLQLRCLEVLKQQENLNDAKKGMGDDFRDYRKQRKVKPMYFEVKLNEANLRL